MAHQVSCLQEQGWILLLPKIQAVLFQAPILAYKKQLLAGFYPRLLHILTPLKCLRQTQRGIGVNKGRKEIKWLRGYFTVLSDKGTSWHHAFYMLHHLYSAPMALGAARSMFLLVVTSPAPFLSRQLSFSFSPAKDSQFPSFIIILFLLFFPWQSIIS